MSDLTKTKIVSNKNVILLKIENIHPNVGTGWLEKQNEKTIAKTAVFFLLEYLEQSENMEHLFYKNFRKYVAKYLQEDSYYHEEAYLTEFGCNYFDEFIVEIIDFAIILGSGNYDYWEKKFSNNLSEENLNEYPYLKIKIQFKEAFLSSDFTTISDEFYSTLDTNLVNWV